MKKIYGIILGVILASAIFFAFDKYMENEIQENKAEVSYGRKHTPNYGLIRIDAFRRL